MKSQKKKKKTMTQTKEQNKSPVTNRNKWRSMDLLTNDLK